MTKPLPRMNVGDKVRYVDEHERLNWFFTRGEIYTVATCESNPGSKIKKFTFVEVPGYIWTCDFFFEDVID